MTGSIKLQPTHPRCNCKSSYGQDFITNVEALCQLLEAQRLLRETSTASRPILPPQDNADIPTEFSADGTDALQPSLSTDSSVTLCASSASDDSIEVVTTTTVNNHNVTYSISYASHLSTMSRMKKVNADMKNRKLVQEHDFFNQDS